MAGISPLGNEWAAVLEKLGQYRNMVSRVDEWVSYTGLNTHLGVAAAPFETPSHFDRKSTRSMGRVALMAALASERALADAGLLGDPLVTSGKLGISYGSSS